MSDSEEKELFGKKGSSQRLLLILVIAVIAVGFFVLGRLIIDFTSSPVYTRPPRRLAETPDTMCMSHLRSVARATLTWSADKGHGKFYPPSMKSLCDVLPDDPPWSRCPATRTQPIPGRFVTDYEYLFDRLNFSVPVEDVPADLPLAWDKPDNHKNVIYLSFADQRVENCPKDRMGTIAFQALMKQVDDWAAKMNAKYPPGRRPAITTAPASAIERVIETSR